jgi:hypothetical protein
MNYAIKSLAITATLLLAFDSSSAQSATSTPLATVQASTTVLAARTSAPGALQNSDSQAPSTLDGLLMCALGVSLVTIQLRRRQKTFRTPLLRT